MISMVLPAHIGHWSASLIYLAPVVLIIVALAVQSWRERRDGREVGPPTHDDHSSDEGR